MNLGLVVVEVVEETILEVASFLNFRGAFVVDELGGGLVLISVLVSAVTFAFLGVTIGLFRRWAKQKLAIKITTKRNRIFLILSRPLGPN